MGNDDDEVEERQQVGLVIGSNAHKKELSDGSKCRVLDKEKVSLHQEKNFPHNQPGPKKEQHHHHRIFFPSSSFSSFLHSLFGL